jgi:uncharacterized protein (TIGR02611 family)
MEKKSPDSEKPRRLHHVRRHSKRVFTAVIGGAVVVIGAVLIPYPGPGWLIVFSGFAILATEFAFAARALDWLKVKYEAWVNWLKRQNRTIQGLVLMATGLVVIVTLWLLNTYGLINSLLHLEWDWLQSPFFR